MFLDPFMQSVLNFNHQKQMKLVGLGKIFTNRSLTFRSMAQMGKQAKFDCDNCAKKIEQPECKSCHRMVNYFNIFQIPQGYKVNQEMIKTMARDLQKEFHPDKCGDESELKEKMQKYSSYINEAKATLLNDLQRAVYLMNLKGEEFQENIQIGSSAFMEEMFVLQEQIEEADLDRARDIKRRLDGILKAVQTDLQLFFTSRDLKKCKEFVIKYKYISRAMANVKNRIEFIQEANSL